jgi:ribosomal protein S27AE
MDYGEEEEAGPFQEFRDRLLSIERFSEQRAVNDKKQVAVTCDICDSEKHVAKSDFERFDSHYCEKHHPTTSGENNPNYIGTDDYRGPNWKVQREKALKRDNYRCVRCGVTNGEHTKNFGYGLHVHHIQPRKEFDDDDPRQNDLSNLISLCHSCHGVYERLPVRPEVIKDE